MTRTLLPPLAALALALLFGLVLSLSLGEVIIAPADLPALLAGRGEDPLAALVLLEIRLPRALVALLVGVALAVAGAIAQAVLRNPLAEPGLLGIHAGAGLAAMLLIVHQATAAPALLPAASFAGATLAAAGIVLLAWRGGASSLRLILIGIGLSALCGALSTLISVQGDVAAVQRAMAWLSGSVSRGDWRQVGLLAAALAVLLAATALLARELDLAAFDDDLARGRGQRVDLLRLLLVLLMALLSGAAVAAAGLIGFVGLVAPHLARLLVGPSHARLLPVAALLGALLMLAADLAGRTVIAPAQLPAGLVTAILGTPFFFLLMWRRSHG